MNKSYLKSKTLWISLIMAIAPLFPQVQAFVAANPESVGMIVGGVFSLLRIKTSQPIVLKEDKGIKIQSNKRF